MSRWRDKYFEFKKIDDPAEKWEFYTQLDFSAEPFEDIYEAALVLLRQRERGDYFYRGQKTREWTIRPSMFRPNNETSIDDEIEKLSSLVRYLQDELGLQRRKALAVAKHYASVPENTEVQSWMLDVSKDPLIACFFATLDSKPEDIGQIFIFKSDEMDRYSPPTAKQMGEVEVISPDGVPRMERQHAAFIDKAHPDLLEGYLPLNYEFHQKEGLTFIDEEESITRENLLPPDDRYKQVVLEWEREIWPEEIHPSRLITPGHNPVDPLDSSDYLLMIEQWLEEMGIAPTELSDESRRSVEDLAEIHHELTASEAVSNYLDSEIALKQILTFVTATSRGLTDEQIAFEEIVNRYWHESGDESVSRSELKRIIESVRPEHTFEREWTDRY